MYQIIIQRPREKKWKYTTVKFFKLYLQDIVSFEDGCDKLDTGLAKKFV